MTPPVPPVAPQGPSPFITGAELNRRIQNGDQNFPKELWGRTMGEAMRYYQIMREDFVTRNRPENQPAPAQPAPRQQPDAYPAASAPAFAPRQPAPQPSAAPTFDEDRLLSRMMEMVRTEIGKSPAVVVAADTVRERVKAKFPDFAHYEQQILEELRGANASDLADPNTWEAAYFYVRGRAEATGQGRPAPAQPAALSGPVHGPRGEWISPPPPPPGMQFVESPAGAPPSSMGGTGAADPRLDPINIQQARRFGIPIDEYVQWLGGQVPPMNGAGR